MKLLSLTVVASAFLLAALPSRADSNPSLTVGGTAVTLVATPIANGTQYTFDKLYTTFLGDDLLGASNQFFTATLTNVAGVGVLNVTDVCAAAFVGVLPISCANTAFTYTAASNDQMTLLEALGLASVNLSGNVANVNFGGSIGGGTAEITIAPAPTPEPESLTLLGTGVIGVAGIVRRRIRFTA